jgi:hypothetical protein
MGKMLHRDEDSEMADGNTEQYLKFERPGQATVPPHPIELLTR